LIGAVTNAHWRKYRIIGANAFDGFGRYGRSSGLALPGVSERPLPVQLTFTIFQPSIGGNRRD
jgi:hypothetical protein